MLWFFPTKPSESRHLPRDPKPATSDGAGVFVGAASWDVSTTPPPPILGLFPRNFQRKTHKKGVPTTRTEYGHVLKGAPLTIGSFPLDCEEQPPKEYLISLQSGYLGVCRVPDDRTNPFPATSAGLFLRGNQMEATKFRFHETRPTGSKRMVTLAPHICVHIFAETRQLINIPFGPKMTMGNLSNVKLVSFLVVFSVVTPIISHHLRDYEPLFCIYREHTISGFLRWCDFWMSQPSTGLISLSSSPMVLSRPKLLIYQGTAGCSPSFHLPGQPISGTYF